jgi:hypothetical protein
MDDLFQTIKTNVLYIAMLIILLVSLVYQFLQKPEDDGDQRPKKTMAFYVALFGGIFFIVTLVIYLIKNSKDFQKDAQDNPVVEKSPVARISKSEYQKQADETTKRELEKLMQSEKYKKMKESKGNDPKKYNWQTAEKEKRTIYRDNEDSDNSDDSLSKVE